MEGYYQGYDGWLKYVCTGILWLIVGMYGFRLIGLGYKE